MQYANDNSANCLFMVAIWQIRLLLPKDTTDSPRKKFLHTKKFLLLWAWIKINMRVSYLKMKPQNMNVGLFWLTSFLHAIFDSYTNLHRLLLVNWPLLSGSLESLPELFPFLFCVFANLILLHFKWQDLCQEVFCTAKLAVILSQLLTVPYIGHFSGSWVIHDPSLLINLHILWHKHCQDFLPCLKMGYKAHKKFTMNFGSWMLIGTQFFFRLG